MTKLKKSLYATLMFILIMIVLVVAEKIHLDSLPMPEDDVELRIRGIWVFASVLVTTLGGIIIFIASLSIFTVLDIFKRLRKPQ